MNRYQREQLIGLGSDLSSLVEKYFSPWKLDWESDPIFEHYMNMVHKFLPPHGENILVFLERKIRDSHSHTMDLIRETINNSITVEVNNLARCLDSLNKTLDHRFGPTHYQEGDLINECIPSRTLASNFSKCNYQGVTFFYQKGSRFGGIIDIFMAKLSSLPDHRRRCASLRELFRLIS